MKLLVTTWEHAAFWIGFMIGSAVSAAVALMSITISAWLTLSP
jgi:hypothetical protein